MCNTNFCDKLTPTPSLWCFYTFLLQAPCQFTPILIYVLTFSVWVIYLSIFPRENIILSYAFLFTPTVSETQMERKTRSWCTFSCSQEFFHTFFKPRVNLLCLRKAATGPNFRPDESVHITHPVTLRFILTSYSINCYVWPMDLLSLFYQNFYEILCSHTPPPTSAHFTIHDSITITMFGEK
jgi:hypothetical protein